MEIVKQKLKYLGYSIVMEEVPDEVSLAINVSGCPRKCEGCHSPYLQEYKGNYVSDDINDLLDKYEGLITCVCFMGGDQNLDELFELCKKVKYRGLKVCIYSGSDSLLTFLSFAIEPNLVDYLKIGEYRKDLGGLDSEATNQIMYKYNYESRRLENITYRFQNRRES